MLRMEEVSEGLDRISPHLAPSHPLIQWNREFVEGVFSDNYTEHAGWDQQGTRAMMAAALSDLGDSYCETLLLNIYSWEPSPIDEEVREDFMSTSVERFFRLASASPEPIRDAWLADAALQYAESRNAPAASEFRVLAWRLSARASGEDGYAAGMCFRNLLNTYDAEILALNAYESGPKRMLISVLAQVLPSAGHRLLLEAIEIETEGHLAMFNADQGRIQGVLVGHERVINMSRDWLKRFNTERSARSEPDRWEAEGVEIDPSRVAGALKEVADAAFLVGLTEPARTALFLAKDVAPWPGADEDLSLMATLLKRCESRS